MLHLRDDWLIDCPCIVGWLLGVLLLLLVLLLQVVIINVLFLSEVAYLPVLTGRHLLVHWLLVV